MSDSCDATRITIEPEKQERAEKLFDEYLEKYCFKHNKTPEEAKEDVIVQCVYYLVYEQGKDKLLTGGNKGEI